MADILGCAFVSSPEALNALLSVNGVDTSGWGSGNAKSMDDLWAEIVAGESRIQVQPLLRVILGAVNVLIRRDERVLIEARQVFTNGMTRHRGLPPAEKMLPGERPMDTAIRCLREELGVARHNIEIVDSAHLKHLARREVRLSPSYPGLSTAYTFHTVEARVKGLPDDDFVTHEYEEGGDEWIMRHDWTWRRA